MPSKNHEFIRFIDLHPHSNTTSMRMSLVFDLLDEDMEITDSNLLFFSIDILKRAIDLSNVNGMPYLRISNRDPVEVRY